MSQFKSKKEKLPRELKCTCWNEKGHLVRGDNGRVSLKPNEFKATKSVPDQKIICPVCGSTNTTCTVPQHF